MPRAYTSTSLTKGVHTELCVFSDSSTMAIGAIAYLRAIQEDGKVEVGFVMGKAKLAPQSEPTIPRLKLCAAVLAVEMVDFIREELDLKLDALRFYTDSKMVLGYIYNVTKHSIHMSITESKVSDNPPNQNNGIMYARKKTLLTMCPDLYLHPILHRVLGLPDLHSCISYLQEQHKLVRCLSSSIQETIRPQVYAPTLLTWRNLYLLLIAFCTFPPSSLYCEQWHFLSMW